MAKTKHSGIEQEMVSSPTRPPRYHPFFTVRDSDGNEERFFTHAFRTAYAAHYWLDMIITACTERNCHQNWKSPTRLLFTDPETNRSLEIKEDRIEDLIEYEPTKEEKLWIPPYPQSQQLNRLSNFWDWQKTFLCPTNTSEPEEQPKSTPKPKKRQPAPNRHKTTKAPVDPNQVTVAQMAAEANIPANKARQILRKAGMKKPEGGWTYAKNDPTIKTIRDLFAKG
jgi:hypothetical protein